MRKLRNYKRGDEICHGIKFIMEIGGNRRRAYCECSCGRRVVFELWGIDRDAERASSCLCRGGFYDSRSRRLKRNFAMSFYKQELENVWINLEKGNL